jgi:hypothetical protein
MLAVQVDWDRFSRYKDAMTPMTLVVVVAVIAVAAWMISRLRARFREDSGRADGKLEMLSQFRELRQQGDLTEDEFRLIKSRLTQDVARQLTATPIGTGNSAKSAVRPVSQEGGTEKTGETGQEGTDLEQSRSLNEPPNQKPQQ